MTSELARKFEALLKAQDEKIENLAKRAGEASLYAPVWQSANAVDFMRELDLLANRENQYSDWLKIGRGDPNFGTVYTKRIQTDLLPTYMIKVFSTTQTIPTSEWTKITTFAQTFSFSESVLTSNSNNYFRWSEDDQRFYLLNYGRRFLLNTYAYWEVNAVGERDITVDTYTKDDVFNGSFFMDIRPAVSESVSNASYYATYFVNEPDLDYYWEYSVWQDSGGDLDITCGFLVGVIE